MGYHKVDDEIKQQEQYEIPEKPPDPFTILIHFR
jgi:hypothetical protein